MTNAKAKAFEALLADLNKDKMFQSDTGAIIAKLGDRPMDVETISSGSLLVDLALGGGFAKGRVIELFGPEASGKTSFSLTAAGMVQKAGGNAVLVDLENAFDPKYAKKLGVDTKELAVSQPDYAEQAMNLVYKLAESGAVDLIIVDSIAALVPKRALEGSAEDNHIGLVARLLSQSLPKIASIANKTKTTIIFINQTREKIGVMFGNPETTTGGKAMQFYASQRVRVSRLSEKVTDANGELSGNVIKFKVVKNKIAPPFKEGTTILTFGHGVDRAGEALEAGAELGVIERPNTRKYIEIETGEVIGNSRAEALQKLQEDSEMLDRISEAISHAFDQDEDEEEIESPSESTEEE